MEEKKTKKFELNTQMLEDFDTIMSTKLDEIEELKITGLDKGSKLLNIISLCANVKTLIIEGDQRLNTDKILANIFKPEGLENLLLNHVKMPKSTSLKRFTNVRTISLGEIRVCPIKEFLEGIVNPEKVEKIEVFHTDVQKCSLACFERFHQLKYLQLNKLENANLNHLQFLKNNPNLLEIEITNQVVPLQEINHLLECECDKTINVSVTNVKGKLLPHGQLKIKEQTSELTVSIQNLQEIVENVKLEKLQKLCVMFNEKAKNPEDIERLKEFKGEIHIRLKDYAVLSVKEANQMKEELSLKKVELIKQRKVTKMSLANYIKVREPMEQVIEKVAESMSDPEKFLTIYQILGREFASKEEEDKAGNEPKLSVCEVLQNCLKSIQINSNIIVGQELENEKKHEWNQVELEGKWYNVDLALDMENIQKNKPEYCLLGDQDFFETHIPKAGKNNYCPENFNPKLVNVFFKTGLFQEKLVASYLQLMAQKIKKLFQFHKKQEVLALPEAEIEEENGN